MLGQTYKTGMEASTHIGKARWDIPAPNLTEADWARHRAQLERHEPFYDFEIRRPDRDGRAHWAAVSGRPIFDEGGRFKGYRGVGRDITDRKLAEMELIRVLGEKQALADRLHHQFENLPIGCLLFDAEHCVSYANAAAERIFGVPAAELLGDNADRFIDPGLHSAIAIRRQRLEAGEEVGPMVLTLRRPDGTERQCEVHSTALRSDDKLIGVIRMLIDVTDREQAQAALRASEQRYRSLIEVAPDGIVLVSNGRIVYANDAMARIMHTTNSDDLVDRSFVELFPAQDRQAVAEQLARLDHEVGPGARADRQLVALDGQLVDVDIRGTSYRWNDGIYMQATIRDNSVRKAIHRRVLEINVELERRVNERTAELQAANRELEAFSYSVAHDLRAPLRAIDGFTRILAEDLGEGVDSSLARSFERVRANVARMAELIDDLLAFARIGRRELEFVDVDMGALARAVLEELRPSYPQATVRIDDLPMVQGDATLLRQVLVNLIGNALKFSSRAEQPLVEVGWIASHGDCIFHVRDNGVGFSMEYAHKLFGVFQRLHGPTEFEGTGVGLAIVQRSIQRHGGRVWAEGEPGKGAVFYFVLRPART
jgi:PAS domain S-box-containing protein